MTLSIFTDQGPGKFNVPTQQRMVLPKRPTVPLNTEPDCKFPGDKDGILPLTLITPRTPTYIINIQ